MVKKTKNARWRIRQEEIWKKRQLAAIQERGDNKELDAVRRIVREEVKSGLDVAVQEAMLKALPELARTIVEEQEKKRKERLFIQLLNHATTLAKQDLVQRR